jgi:methionine-rich copper-binding protein CopC
MKYFSLIASLALVSVGLTSPAATLAHSKIMTSTPSEGATVAKLRVVELNFTEGMLTPTAVASIVMTDMPGVKNHGEMVIRNFTPSWSNNNRTLTLSLRQPLRAGSYEVRWQAAGADGHRMTGKVSFKVS